MRFYRLLRYDLRQGLQRRNYLIATLLFSMRLFAVYRSVQFYCNVESISSRGSIGDYMLCLFRGMAIIQHGSMEEKVSVPIEWLIVCGFCLYITAAYPAQGISVQGQQVFLRTSRGKWWLSKCIWCIASCTLYFACEMIAIIGTAILTPVTFTHAGKCYPIRFAPSVCDAYGRMYAANTLKPCGPSGHQLSNMLCHIYCCRIFPH